MAYPFSWQNQRVLITGGSTGIGFALAGELMRRGAHVAVCARDTERLDRARMALGPALVTLPADLTDPHVASDLIARAVLSLGGLSVLVNNAGVQRLYEFHERAHPDLLRDVDQEIAVNLRAPIALVHAALPHLRAAASRHAAAIVNVSSGLALVPKRSAPTYCATKAALHSWTMSLRWQLASHVPELRVHEALLPLVDTDMTRGRGANKRSPESVAKDIADGVARGREEIRVGKVALLSAITRLAPGVAQRIMRDS